MFNAYIRKFVRRDSWGPDPESVARRARETFGAPPVYRRLVSRGLQISEVSEAGLRGEWVSPSKPGVGVILYIHGGGFVSCSPGAHRPVTAALARLTQRRVFCVDYRLAPEHPFPTAVDDVVAGYRWLLEQARQPKSIAVVGDSAGGGLVLSLLLRLRSKGIPMPASGVCLSAWTDLSGASGSISSNDGKCHMFRPANIHQFAAAYLSGTPATDPVASPVYGDLSGLPPILMQVGSTELLLDDSLRVRDAIVSAGGSCEVEIYDDLAHGWHLAAGFVPEASDALRKVSEFIRRHSFDDDAERRDAAGEQTAS